MFQSKINGRGGRVALLAALSALMVAVGASAASAKVIVTPNEGVESGSNVVVSGTAPPTGTTEVTAILCNATAEPGERCDPVSGTPGFKTATAYATGFEMLVRRGAWADWNFSMGFPPSQPEPATTTTCFSESEGGEPCEVVVSFYEATEKGPKQLGTDVAPISFE